MERDDWIGLCAHRLQRQWRTVDPEVLEDVAADLWADSRWRALPPAFAAVEWLQPVVRQATASVESAPSAGASSRGSDIVNRVRPADDSA